MIMSLPIVSLPLNLQIYRVRFVNVELSKDKRKQISEFGYNPDKSNIKRMRLNLPMEQVLYTSTNPRVSYAETVNSSLATHMFYLSVWRKKDEDQLCNCFLSSFNSCSDNLDSNAGKIKNEYYSKLSEEDLENVKNIGKILEKKYSPGDQDIYVESSQQASEILKQFDCIMTPSAKDSKEINITYNKKFTDYSLILDRVYLCDKFPNGQDSLVFRVKKIGIVQDGLVIWYNWNIKDGTLVDANQKPMINKIRELEKLLFPNVNKAIDDWHDGIYNQNHVKFKIEIAREDD